MAKEIEQKGIIESVTSLVDFERGGRIPPLRKILYLPFSGKALRVGIIAGAVAIGYFLEPSLTPYVNDVLTAILPESLGTSVVGSILPNALSFVAGAVGGGTVLHAPVVGNLMYQRRGYRNDIAGYKEKSEAIIKDLPEVEKLQKQQELEEILANNNKPSLLQVQRGELKRFLKGLEQEAEQHNSVPTPVLTSTSTEGHDPQLSPKIQSILANGPQGTAVSGLHQRQTQQTAELRI